MSSLRGRQCGKSCPVPQFRGTGESGRRSGRSWSQKDYSSPSTPGQKRNYRSIQASRRRLMPSNRGTSAAERFSAWHLAARPRRTPLCFVRRRGDLQPTARWRGSSITRCLGERGRARPPSLGKGAVAPFCAGCPGLATAGALSPARAGRTGTARFAPAAGRAHTPEVATRGSRAEGPKGPQDARKLDVVGAGQGTWRAAGRRNGLRRCTPGHRAQAPGFH